MIRVTIERLGDAVGTIELKNNGTHPDPKTGGSFDCAFTIGGKTKLVKVGHHRLVNGVVELLEKACFAWRKSR